VQDGQNGPGSALRVMLVTVPPGFFAAAAVVSRHSGGIAALLAVLGGVSFVVLTVWLCLALAALRSGGRRPGSRAGNRAP
jgi:hypothetical protein